MLGRWIGGDDGGSARRLQRLPPGRSKLLLPAGVRLVMKRRRLLEIGEKQLAVRRQLDPRSQRAGVVPAVKTVAGPVGRARACHLLDGRRGRDVGGERHSRQHTVEALKWWHKIVGGAAAVGGGGEDGGFGRPRTIGRAEEGICGVGSRRPAAEIGKRL